MKKNVPILILALPILAFVVFSFKGLSAVSRLNKSSYSGEQLFTAIYFSNTKSLSTGLSEKLKCTSSQKRNLEALIKDIKNSRADFFHSFKEEITSGDKNRIKAKLLESSALLVKKLNIKDGATDPYVLVAYPPLSYNTYNFSYTYTDVNAQEVVVPPSFERSTLGAGRQNLWTTENMAKEIARLF